MKGDVTVQRRWEAYDKLGSFVVYVVSFVLTIQAIGLESKFSNYCNCAIAQGWHVFFGWQWKPLVLPLHNHLENDPWLG